MDRDFDVDFEGEIGDSGEFEGKHCKIINKRLSTRAGIGPVIEQIKCKSTKIILKTNEEDLEL